MTKIYLLYYGNEDGSAEDCSIFYVEPEAFFKQEDCLKREEEVLQEYDYTHILEVEVN